MGPATELGLSLMTRYLLKSPTGQFFCHPEDRGNNHWTADPATAHAWVDWDRAAAAVSCWHLLHGETLAVVQK